jgi:hypothetical protein
MDEKQEPVKRNVTLDGHNNQLTEERKRGRPGIGCYRDFVTPWMEGVYNNKPRGQRDHEDLKKENYTVVLQLSNKTLNFLKIFSRESG